MTTQQLKDKFPNASASFVEANCHNGQHDEHHNLQEGSQPQPAIRDEPLEKAERKEGHATGVYVRVVSFRTRLTDPDNLCPKYFIDCLRYAKIIPNDTQEDIELAVIQRKVATRKEERTEIMIGKLNA